uniref:Uncharacterized protein n=1 Tax=Tanacetum cinerariifolium TaxID=118510 RepID=A0A699GR80_TANCI|nr:hypothetical protein [Tanacetum cinerariifolium]
MLYDRCVDLGTLAENLVRVFWGFFEKQKLTGPNFIDWYRQPRIVLSVEDKLNYIEYPILAVPVPAHAGQQVAPEALAAHVAWVKGSKEIELKTLFAQQAEQELLQPMREFHSCKQKEGQSVSSYVLKLKSYTDNLEHLGHPVTLGLGASLILILLRKEFNGFVQNYNMHSIGKTINELHAMLKLLEQTLPKNNAPTLHAIRAGKVQKRNKRHQKPQPQLGARGQNQRKGKNKLTYAPKPKIPPPPKREDPAKDSICHQCATKEPSLTWTLLSYGIIILDTLARNHIEKLQHDGLLNSNDLRAFEKCVPCMSGKIARKPYAHQVERAKDLLGLIHTDVCGPFKIVSRPGASYFVTFTYDFSRYGYVYLLKHKHEVFKTFKVFQKEVENQLVKTIKSLGSDRGGEEDNRTLLDMVRSMMSQTTLPKLFWNYALETAARILNMVPTKKGCEVLVMRDTLTKPEKLKPTSIKCIFIGYPKETMGYSFYYPPKNEVLVVQNAKFLENSLITQEASWSLEDLEIIQEEDTHPSIDTSLNHEEDDLEIDEHQSDIIPIRSKWLFKKKTDMDGSVHTYKARVVTNGYTQTLRIDYEETFSPVAYIRAIRILRAIVAFYDYEI